MSKYSNVACDENSERKNGTRHPAQLAVVEARQERVIMFDLLDDNQEDDQ